MLSALCAMLYALCPMPIVSVIITTRNEEANIENCHKMGNRKWEMGKGRRELVALYIPERIIGKG